jgi:putative membrane protein
MGTVKIYKHALRVALLAMTVASPGLYAEGAKSAMGSPSPSTSGQSGSSSTAGFTDSSAGTATKGSVSAADQRMMRQMAQSNIAEIEAGKMAQSKSQNEQIKSFAQKMIDDHTKAQQDLQKVAQAKGVTLPTTADAKHQAMAKKLAALSGNEFDRRYMMQGGLQDHRATHRLLQRMQSRARDADLKNLAAQTLPVVNEHLTTAQQLQASIKTGGTAAGSSGTGGAATGSGAAGGSGTSGGGGGGGK